MNTTPVSDRSATRVRRQIIAIALLLVLAGCLAFAIQQSFSAAATAIPGAAPLGSGGGASAPAYAPEGADGSVRDGQRPSVFDENHAAVQNLDPALREALQRAATDASDDRVDFVINSGWRSADLQARALEEAIAKYGSASEAARWVGTPETSAHVSGDAVDLGPSSALDWLARHGDAYGLCQIYANESWHYELRPGAMDEGCPQMYSDPSQDPRMKR